MASDTGSVSPWPDPVLIAVQSPSEAASRAVLRAYIDDVASRYLGRRATDAEIDAALLADPSDDLRPPTGVLLVATQGRATVGCAGLRLLPDRLGEVKRVFVEPAARGNGLGARLMAELERRACGYGLTRLRLDTRSDLVEARAMYAALGYEEVPAFSTGSYSERWFAKTLT